MLNANSSHYVAFVNRVLAPVFKIVFTGFLKFFLAAERKSREWRKVDDLINRLIYLRSRQSLKSVAF